MEFRADYPLRETDATRGWPPEAVLAQGKPRIRTAQTTAGRAAHGPPLHARTTEDQFPDWKIDFIRKNRDIYRKHRAWIDRWIPSILPFPSSLQKLEWNCKGGERDIWKYVIQFRASGVRVKRPTSSPSLVAMTTTQVPIIGWEKRYMGVSTARRSRPEFHPSLGMPKSARYS